MASVEAISVETSSIEDSETVSVSEVKRPSIPLRDKYSLRGFMKYLQGNPWDMVLRPLQERNELNVRAL